MLKQIISLLIFATIFCLSITAQKQTKQRELPKQTIIQPTMDERLSQLSQEISLELTDNQKKTVAVAEFVNLKGDISDLGKYLAEELTTKLFKSKKLKVVERQLINKVIAEQKLSLTEIIEASAAKKIGRILGVEAIVVGTISDLGKTLRINARIIGTETGEVFAAAATEVYKDESVCNLIKCTGVINSNNTESVIITEPVKKMESVKNDTKKIQPKRPQYKILTQQLGRYIYELLSCQITGSTVICELQITNNDYETYASFPAGGRTQISILYDQSGNESYLTKKGEFANGAESAFLVKGVPIRVKLTFGGVSPETTKATLLRLGFQPQNGSYWYIDFRDVPIFQN